MKKPGVRHLAWLVGLVCIGLIGVVVSGWRADSSDGATVPQAAAMPTPAPAPETARAEVVPEPAAPAPSAATVAAVRPAPVAVAKPASSAAQRPPADASRLQRDIQLAIASDERGKAGEAAKHILLCMSLERSGGRPFQFMERQQQQPPAEVVSAMRSAEHNITASCQAVDAASRAQLVPLLRRSLAEGDKGAAAKLVRALGADFKLADEPGVLPALRRDAWDCDLSSQVALSGLLRNDPQLLSPNEVGALRDQQRANFAVGMAATLNKPDADPRMKAVMEGLLATYKPPPEADPAEVARISADIQSRCPAAPAGRAGG